MWKARLVKESSAATLTSAEAAQQRWGEELVSETQRQLDAKTALHQHETHRLTQELAAANQDAGSLRKDFNLSPAPARPHRDHNPNPNHDSKELRRLENTRMEEGAAAAAERRRLEAEVVSQDATPECSVNLTSAQTLLGKPPRGGERSGAPNAS